MRLDLGGIGKGYAADEAMRVLRRHNISRALVAAGGDIVAGDSPPGAQGWDVRIAGLSMREAHAGGLLLRNGATSTSGDAEQFVEIAGKRYSHVIDPRTGVGVTGRTSVTVVAPDGITSDAIDNAVGVLGAESGLRFVEAGAAILAG